MVGTGSKGIIGAACVVAATLLIACAPLKSGVYYKPVDAGEKGFMRTPQDHISRPLGQGARMELSIKPLDPEAEDPTGVALHFKVTVPQDVIVQFGSRTFRVRDEESLQEFTHEAQFALMHQIKEPEDSEEKAGHETWEIDFLNRFRGETYEEDARILPDTLLHNFYTLDFTLEELTANRFSVFFPVAQVNTKSVEIIPVQFERAESKWYMGEIVP